MNDKEAAAIPALKGPAQVSSQLRRLVPDLKAAGIHVTFNREGRPGTRVIHIRREDAAVSTVSTISGAGGSEEVVE